MHSHHDRVGPQPERRNQLGAIRPIVVVLTVMMVCATSAHGQWKKNGKKLYYNSDNVGIGTANPQYKLDVRSKAGDRAIFGLASALAGDTYGVYGQSKSTTGVGVYGLASASGGTNYGVLGQTNSPDGYAGFFLGGANFFEGNVGIGTEFPNTMLHIDGTGVDNDGSTAVVRIISGNGAQNLLLDGNEIDATADGLFLNGNSNQNLILVNGGGNVGIGTDVPLAHLHVAGSGANTGVLLDLGGDLVWTSATNQIVPILTLHTDNDVYLDAPADAGSDIHFRTGASNSMTILTNGNVGIGTDSPAQVLDVNGSVQASCGILTCSDERFKTRVAPLDSAMALIEQLRPVRFDWRIDEYPDRQFSEQRQIGLIAQEVLGVLPEIVMEGSDGYYSVDYGRMTPVLAKALCELRAEKDGQIKALQDHVASLQDRLGRLESLIASPKDGAE